MLKICQFLIPFLPVRSAYVVAWTPFPLYAQSQLAMMYDKYNTEFVNRFIKLSFYTIIFIFNYNIKFIKCKCLRWIYKKKGFVHNNSDHSPLPPVRNAYTSAKTPRLRVYILYKWPLKGDIFHCYYIFCYLFKISNICLQF